MYDVSTMKVFFRYKTENNERRIGLKTPATSNPAMRGVCESYKLHLEFDEAAMASLLCQTVTAIDQEYCIT